MIFLFHLGVWSFVGGFSFSLGRFSLGFRFLGGWAGFLVFGCFFVDVVFTCGWVLLFWLGVCWFTLLVCSRFSGFVNKGTGLCGLDGFLGLFGGCGSGL